MWRSKPLACSIFGSASIDGSRFRVGESAPSSRAAMV
jgi:hypothetical protein